MARFPTQLGNVRTANAPLATFRPTAAAAPLEPVAQGLADLGVGAAEFANNTAQAQSFETERNFIIYQGEQLRRQLEAETSAPSNFENFSQGRQAELGKASEEFLATVPAHLQEEYRTKLESFGQDLVTKSLGVEIQGRTKFQADSLEVTLQEFQSRAHSSPQSAEIFAQEWVGLVQRSTLPPQAKEAALRTGFQALLEAQYTGEAIAYSEGIRFPQNADGNDVAFSESVVQRALLNTISSTESDGSYTQIVFGGRFDDFSDHPRVFKDRSDGRKTSAAGRYQFVASTWDEVAAQLGLPDFSPESQDRAAWHRAKWRFKKESGGDLETELLSGDRERIKAVRKFLAPEWEGLTKISDDEFANRFLGSGSEGAPGVRGQVAATRRPPDIWNDPRFAAVPYEQKFKLARFGQQLAEQALSERKAEEKAVFGEKFNQALVDARNGLLSESQVEEANATWVKDFDDQQKLRGAFQAFQREDGDVRGFQAAVAGGTAIFSYTDTEDRNRWDAYYNRFLKEGITARDESVVNAALLPLVERTRMFPPQLMKDLQGLAASRDVRDVTFGMNTMAFLEDHANQAFKNEATEQQISDLRWWRTEGQFFTGDPEDMLLRLQRRTDTKFEPIRKVWEQQADDFIQKELTVDKIVGRFGGFFTIDPELPPSTAINAAFQNTFQGLFREEMQRYGDPEKAMDAAAERIKTRWGVSEVGGRKRIIEYAPETIYPAVGLDGGTKDWIENQARVELSRIDPRFRSDSFEFMLIPDGNTRKEYDAFKADNSQRLPSYIVTFIDEDGMLSPLRSPEGKVVRWGGQVTPEMRFDVEKEAGRIHTERQAQRVRSRLNELQTQQSPFGGAPVDAEEVKRLEAQLRGLQQTLEVGFSETPGDLLTDIEVVP